MPHRAPRLFERKQEIFRFVGHSSDAVISEGHLDLQSLRLLEFQVSQHSSQRSLTHFDRLLTDALVELLDLYPTLADLCELKTPREVEGVSLVPLLNDPNAKGKDFALTQTPRPNYVRGALPRVMGYSIRTERYRYTEWREFQIGVVQAREL